VTAVPISVSRPSDQPNRSLRPTPTNASSVGPGVTGVRLARALLFYLLAITLVITLLPFRFAWPEQARIALIAPPADLISNVLMFVPLGFLYRLSRSTDRVSPGRVLLLGLLASAAIECAQILEVDRYPSPWDVLTNGIGAWAGALIHQRIERRLAVDARLVGRLSLELPLMGLVYLLVPLLWINALAAGSDGSRVVLTMAISVFGASLLAAAQRYHFGPVRRVPVRATAAAAVAWFAVGAFPAIPRHPVALVLAGVIAGAIVLVRGRGEADMRPINRRFEVPTLRATAPIYLGYLCLLPLVALGGSAGSWHFTIGVGGLTSDWSPIEILRLLERLAAFTLLGYLIAEFRGRFDRGYASTVPRVLLWGALVGAITEGLWGFRAGSSASLVVLALALIASLYGGWLYHLQRDHVRALLAER
jgi:glycopeptide antibiotics resistance protein